MRAVSEAEVFFLFWISVTLNLTIFDTRPNGIGLAQVTSRRCRSMTLVSVGPVMKHSSRRLKNVWESLFLRHRDASKPIFLAF